MIAWLSSYTREVRGDDVCHIWQKTLRLCTFSFLSTIGTRYDPALNEEEDGALGDDWETWRKNTDSWMTPWTKVAHCLEYAHLRLLYQKENKRLSFSNCNYYYIHLLQMKPISTHACSLNYFSVSLWLNENNYSGDIKKIKCEIL